MPIPLVVPIALAITGGSVGAYFGFKTASNPKNAAIIAGASQSAGIFATAVKYSPIIITAAVTIYGVGLLRSLRE